MISPHCQYSTPSLSISHPRSFRARCARTIGENNSLLVFYASRLETIAVFSVVLLWKPFLIGYLGWQPCLKWAST
eukprot:1891950-Amphidinium_carterae.1